MWMELDVKQFTGCAGCVGKLMPCRRLKPKHVSRTTSSGERVDFPGSGKLRCCVILAQQIFQNLPHPRAQLSGRRHFVIVSLNWKLYPLPSAGKTDMFVHTYIYVEKNTINYLDLRHFQLPRLFTNRTLAEGQYSNRNKRNRFHRQAACRFFN